MGTLTLIGLLFIIFVCGVGCGIPLGRWIQRRRAAGKTPAEILAEAKARVKR